ncbi:FliM/FliN family flagellar motor switch protein [Acidocella facilis]|uniref:FliM/FliN family flagellar motor switch protein n=1 Tax=Acidocella facilis TaxID=525 RepID=UPI001F31F4C9|nr:FliM/FliN family flagellar motor switch protein [Acidocella facilis]
MLDAPSALLRDPTDIKPLDLLNHVRAPGLRPGLMETLSARFMRQIALALFKTTRSPVSLLSSKTGIAPHEAVLERLPDVLLAGHADLAPLRGRALLALDGALLGAIVDGMCGASIPSSAPAHDLSAMELRIGRQLIEAVYKSASDSLAPLGIAPLVASSYETAHAMLGVAEAQDWMIEITGQFETALGQGRITIALPFAPLDALEQKLLAQSGANARNAADEGWAARLAASSEAVKLPLCFEIARGHLPMSLVSALRPGALLPLSLLPEAIAVSGGVDLFRAEYGQFEGAIACRVSPGQDLQKGQTMTDTPPEIALEPLSPLPGQGHALDGSKLLDRVQVAIAVELGRAALSVKEMRALRQGQVIALDQRVGEPLVIYANGLKLAHGEVVAIGDGERYGIRITGLAGEAEAETEPQQEAAE